MLRRHWFTVLSAAVSVVTLVLLWRWIRSQGELRLPTDAAALRWIAVGVVVYLSSFLVRGLRWLVLLREVGVDPPLRETTGLLTVGYAANTLLPARAGDAVRVFLMARRERTGATLMVSTLIAERLLDVVVLATAFAVTSVVFSGAVPSGGHLPLLVAVAAVGVAGLAAVAWALRTDKLPPGVAGILRDASIAVRQLRGSRHLALVLALTIGAWTCEAAVYWLAGQAVGISLDAGEAVYVLSTAAMFTMIPSGPGFAGTMDGAIVLTLRALDAPRQLVFGYIAVVRFVIFIPITLLGGGLLALRYGGLSAIRAARRAQEQENDEAELAAHESSTAAGRNAQQAG